MKICSKALLAISTLTIAAGFSSAARAGLQIESLFITASALVTPPSGQTNGTTWFWDSNLSLPLQVVSSGARSGGLAAGARQTPDGFFFDQAGFERGWESPAGQYNAEARTSFQLAVSTDTPNTPLILDFHFLGSQLSGGAYYGAGTMTVGTTLSISSARLGTPRVEAWGFDDRLLLNSTNTNGNFTRQSNGTDSQGIGLPQLTDSFGWQQFASRGDAQRLPFVGTLDFGLLQPGEVFKLYYEGSAAINAGITYAGDAAAKLVDPFSLGGTPPLQLELRGLTLPAAPIPEPGSVLLMLLGLAAVAIKVARSRELRP